MTLRLSDGATLAYHGNGWVFGWSHENSLFIGQLHSALAALERWLCDLVDASQDVATQIDELFRKTNSVSVLGVLVNLGKHKPELFKGPLRPLIGMQQAYDWDAGRVKADAYSFDGMAWARHGDLVFEMAKTWGLAPYRKRRLRDIIPTMIVTDNSLAEFVLTHTSQWVAPASDKELIDFRILVAELDHRNYRAAVDPATGRPAFEFEYPKDVGADIARFQQDHARLLQALRFPDTCRKILNTSHTLNAQEAEWVASLLAAVDGDEEIDVEKEMLDAPRAAAATVLVLRASEWIKSNAAVGERARSIIDTAIAGIADDAGNRSMHFRTTLSYLEFVAYFAVDRWIAEPSKENDERVLRLLTSGDDDAVSVLVGLAYQARQLLGQRWWRLLYLAVLWAGLCMLAPRYGDDDADGVRWQRWRRWLRTRSLSVGNTTPASIDPLAVAMRVERFEYHAWQRRSKRQGRRFAEEPGRRLSGSLETHFLQHAFAWLFQSGTPLSIAAEELDVRRRLVTAFWAHQAWWLSGSGKDAEDDFQPMHEFGYAVLLELSRLVMASAAEAGPGLWQPVFALGPKAHYAIGHFLSGWFNSISQDTDISEFAKRWRPMIEFCVLDTDWSKGGPWYYGQQIERHVLAFGETKTLARILNHSELIQSMRALYKTWAANRLGWDEDNLAGLCNFLSSDVGRPLRIEGLHWIVEAMTARPEVGKWFRDRTSNSFMEFLDVLVSENAAELSKDEKAREGLLALVALAVSRQFVAAQALQERIRRMF